VPDPPHDSVRSDRYTVHDPGETSGTNTGCQTVPSDTVGRVPRARTRSQETVRKYDTALEQRTPAALTDLVDEMVERLEAAGGDR